MIVYAFLGDRAANAPVGRGSAQPSQGSSTQLLDRKLFLVQSDTTTFSGAGMPQIGAEVKAMSVGMIAAPRNRVSTHPPDNDEAAASSQTRPGVSASPGNCGLKSKGDDPPALDRQTGAVGPAANPTLYARVKVRKTSDN